MGESDFHYLYIYINVYVYWIDKLNGNCKIHQIVCLKVFTLKQVFNDIKIFFKSYACGDHLAYDREAGLGLGLI